MTQDLREEFEEMLNELESSCLEVVLVPHKNPPNEGAMLRVAVNKNPKWYSDLCNSYVRQKPSRGHNSRLPHTYINRASILRSLKRLVRGGYKRGVTADRLLVVAKQRILNKNKNETKQTL